MMRSTAMASPVVLFTLLLSFAAPANGNPQREQERSLAALAASMAIAELKKTIGQIPPDSEALYEKMRSSPGEYRAPGKAKEDLEGFYAQGVERIFAERAANVLRKLSRTENMADFFGEGFVSGATNAPKAEIMQYTASHYAESFRAARKRACEEQSARLSKRIRPTEEEIETIPGLEAILTERIANAQDEAVFDENRNYLLLSVVRPMIEDALAQREFQRAFVRNCNPGFFAPSFVVKGLVSRLEEAIGYKREMAEDPSSVYSAFPSVLARTIPAEAEKISLQRLEKSVRETQVPLSASLMREQMLRDIRLHKKPGKSREIFAEPLAANLAHEAARSLMELAPKEEREELAAFAAEQTKKKEYAKLLKSESERRVENLLSPIRREMAQGQISNHFANIASGAWHLDGAAADKMAGGADISKEIARWRNHLPEIAAREESACLIEEASALLDGMVKKAANLAMGARRMQHETAEGLFGDVKEEALGRWQSPALEDLTLLYREKTMKRWGELSLTALDGECAKRGIYLDLFPSTLEKIDDLCRKLMEAMKSEPLPPDPVPAQEPQAAPPAEEELLEMDCAIAIGRSGDAIEAEVKVDGVRLASYSCPYDPKAYMEKSGAFTGDTAGALISAVRDAARKNRVSLKILLVVSDPLIYHGTVYDISRRITEETEKMGESLSGFAISEERAK